MNDDDDLTALATRELGPRLLAQLRKAIRRSGDAATVEELIRLSRRGQVQWWQSDDAVEITRMEVTDDGVVMRLLYTAGDLSQLLGTLLPMITDYARSLQCVGLVGRGRPGWSRFASAYGFSWDGEDWRRPIASRGEVA